MAKPNFNFIKRQKELEKGTEGSEETEETEETEDSPEQTADKESRP